jgi:hypothetical protein
MLGGFTEAETGIFYNFGARPVLLGDGNSAQNDMRKVPHIAAKSPHSTKKLAYTKVVNSNRKNKMQEEKIGYHWTERWLL